MCLNFRKEWFKEILPDTVAQKKISLKIQERNKNGCEYNEGEKILH